MKKATRQHTKTHNRILVLKTFFEQESISRADLARMTRLTRTTISDIVAALLEEGLVEEIGMGESQGGKSPILLSLAKNSRYLIGLDLSHSEFRGAVVNLRGEICAAACTPVNDLVGKDALALVYQTLDVLLEAGFQPLVGIGVGTPGLVNSVEGMVINAVNLEWNDLPLAEMLEQRYHLPVKILNDSQAAAMGEYTYGASHPAESNLVVINARHGLGAGIIIQGRLFQGDGGGAGEVGHIVVAREDSLRCRCGNYGCLETVASVQSIVKRVKQHMDGSHNDNFSQTRAEVNLKTIHEAYLAGDPLIREIVLESGRYMGIAVSTLIGTLNIQKIILSGDLTCFGEQWLTAIQDTVSQMALPRLTNETQIDIGQLGSNGILLGASAILANDYALLFMQA